MFEAFFVAAALSCMISLLIVWSQGWHGKLSMDHDLTGVQKFHAQPVPRVGGVALYFGMLATLCLSSMIASLFVTAFPIENAYKLMIAGTPAFVAGIVEDTTKRVSVKMRLVATFSSALSASWLLGTTLDGVDIWGVDLLLHYMPFALAATAITVAGGTNAINIIDGFNGLAGTAALVILSALCILAWQVNDIVVINLALLGMGAAIGFLMVNYPTGRLFLGDGGAYFLGFWISEIAVMLLVRNPGINAWQVLGVCSYPVIEVLYSIYRRKIVRKVSPGMPDRLHLHSLIYRRIVCQHIARDDARPWIRNAAVVWIAGAVMILMSSAAVLFGASVVSAVMIVIAQVTFYIAFYTRLVRGQWWWQDVFAPPYVRSK